MAQKVESDESHDFKKLFGPFWFFLYYLMGYPLRILGCFLDGFVIYWLVYDVRESNFQAWLAAITGAILIQVVLGLSTTVSAKNLFRGLLFRSVAYALMFLVTATFAGGSLYSTLYLSKNGSAVAVEAFSPKLKPVTTEAVRQKSDQSVNTLAAQQAQEVAQLTATNKEAKAELKAQIKAVERTITKNQRIVDSYAEGVTVPWEYRSPIITGQKELKKLNRELLALTTKHQDNLAATRNQQHEERALARKVGLASLDEVKAVNEQKAAKLDIYGLLAVGGNVGINLLSFFIMLGYELFLKFSGDEGGNSGSGRFTKPLRFSKPERETEPERNDAATQKKEESAENLVAQETQPKEEGAAVRQLGTVRQLTQTQTKYFPYQQHRKNARTSFRRSFQVAKDAETTNNRMATAQQHINALLWHGFNVSVDEKYKTRLLVDALEAPTLEKGKWECVVRLEGEEPVLEKFEMG